jgi:hypothetical protein
MQVSTCVWWQGEHVQAGRFCSHRPGVDIDPEGQEHPVGWTVQKPGGKDAQ